MHPKRPAQRKREIQRGNKSGWVFLQTTVLERNMDYRNPARMGRMCCGGEAPPGLSRPMWPHLTSADIELIIGLRALWKAPEWGMKVLSLAYAVRRYRRSSP